jgi:hypothetical protein
MELAIFLPYATLLDCRLDTTVLVVNGKDIRRIGDILAFYQAHGWNGSYRHLPAEQPSNWWGRVRCYVEGFDWGLYRLPSLPTVKPYEGTLEFCNGGGNHRAMAVAIRGADEYIPVVYDGG